MIIDLLYFDGCPNYEPAARYIEDTLKKLNLPDIEIRHIEILTELQAQQMKFLGSPTIQIFGLDIEIEARARGDYGFSCRLYSGGDVPAFDVLESAIEEAQLGIHSTMVDAFEPVQSCDAKPIPAEKDYHRWVAGGSLLAAVVASACCWLPLLLLTLGVSSGGIGLFLSATRPTFLGVAVVALGTMVFLQFHNHRNQVSCSSCSETERKMRFPAYTWVVILLAGVFAFLPTYLPDLIPNASANAIDSDAAARTVSMTIEEMSCSGCAMVVEETVAPISGVTAAFVDFDTKRLDISIGADETVSMEQIIERLEANGFTAKLQEDSD